MDEKIFFEDGGVKITNARFIVGSKTYAMSGVTSVKTHVEPPNRMMPIIIGAVGVLLLFVQSIEAIVFGLILAGVAFLIWRGQSEVHSVILSSSSGEVQALSDTNGERIGAVIAALNDVLIHRG